MDDDAPKFDANVAGTDTNANNKEKNRNEVNTECTKGTNTTMNPNHENQKDSREEEDGKLIESYSSTFYAGENDGGGDNENKKKSSDGIKRSLSEKEGMDNEKVHEKKIWSEDQSTSSSSSSLSSDSSEVEDESCVDEEDDKGNGKEALGKGICMKNVDKFSITTTMEGESEVLAIAGRSKISVEKGAV